MLFAIEVVDRFDRIEGGEGHLYEDGVPIAHSAVPETGQFKCLEFLAVLTLVGDESRGGVDVLGQVEAVALVVLEATDEVHGVEVRALLEHGFLFGVGMGDFSFSQNYCFFYDQLEKSNLFLQSVIDNASKPMDDRFVEWLFKNPFLLSSSFPTSQDIYIMVLSLMELMAISLISSMGTLT